MKSSNHKHKIENSYVYDLSISFLKRKVLGEFFKLVLLSSLIENGWYMTLVIKWVTIRNEGRSVINDIHTFLDVYRPLSLVGVSSLHLLNCGIFNGTKLSLTLVNSMQPSLIPCSYKNPPILLFKCTQTK